MFLQNVCQVSTEYMALHSRGMNLSKGKEMEMKKGGEGEQKEEENKKELRELRREVEVEK